MHHLPFPPPDPLPATHRLAWGLPAVLAALLLAGCSTPAPAPVSPPASVGAVYREAPPPRPDALEAATWRGFGDPALEALLARARSANLDVRIAAQRVQQAQAGSRAAASRLRPGLSLTASASDQRSGLPDEVKRGSPDTRAFRAGLELGWELDVFGSAGAGAFSSSISTDRIRSAAPPLRCRPMA